MALSEQHTDLSVARKIAGTGEDQIAHDGRLIPHFLEGKPRAESEARLQLQAVEREKVVVRHDVTAARGPAEHAVGSDVDDLIDAGIGLLAEVGDGERLVEERFPTENIADRADLLLDVRPPRGPASG